MNFISAKDIDHQEDASKKEEPIDNRPLYDRLKEVRDKKQMEYEEAHKLKNQFRGIDEDEANFLRMVDVSKSEAESQRKREENELIRNVIVKAPQTVSADLQPVSIRPKVPATKTVNKQASLLAGAIRKRPHPEERKSPSNPSASAVAKPSHTQLKVTCVKANGLAPVAQSMCRVIGVLPGLLSYQDSSDSNSDRSSDSEEGGAEFSVSSMAQKSQQTAQRDPTGQPAGSGGCRT